MTKILVIDDERAIRNTLKDILEFEGYTVDVAENGRIGLEMALAAKYDLIYTDIKMPEMDGMEMMQAYRKTTNELGLEEAPVVMMALVICGMPLTRNLKATITTRRKLASMRM